ncbi:extracellular solute-binding protein [Patescibacteria group bacterium]|nr:extracellular solute-binding protein [Patescibacteria group bacterium]MBU1663570.1 extracellular solute-binding protein [Patescibacteria group bacterium]MBU1934035.1 extracellular solute-binding protein [Patescibacteria group bacterium]MBU2007975.1 extracellular solute-binding protein [Patescibacteria group bacterium]MBU2264117.1 extracellular solute-binding protein [Patescibacteria group bacterium]
MKTKIITLFLLFIFLLTSGFGCKLVDQQTQDAMKPITLTYWRVYDGQDAFEEILAAYKKLHPFITINYRKLRYSEYENELINALAEDRGPDIFSIHNTWTKKYLNKITPMPATITMAYPVIRGTIKKEVIPELRTAKSLDLNSLKNNFVDAVYQDVVIPTLDEKTKQYKQKVYGLPLSVDTLAMYYNKDLFNNAGVAEPPVYWNNIFQQDVKKMTKQNDKGEIIQSGASLGGANNIERYSDILSVLMMQNGSVMMDDSDQVLFNRTPAAFKDQKYNPGLEALRFYTDFNNPSKEVYAWNKNLDNSLNMFTQGKLGIMFGYAYHLPIIKAQAPKLNFSIAKLPQIEGNTPINFANYWIETVSNKSKHTDESWDFIQFETQADQVKTYLAKAKKPTALRALVNEQINDLDISVFAEQVLTAKSWYKGADSNAMEKIFADMIDTVILSQDKIENVINLTANKVQQTVNVNSQ